MGKEKMKEDKKTIDISKLRYYVIAFCLFATFVIGLNFIFLPSETQPQDTIIIEIKQDEWFIKDVCVSCRTMGRGTGSDLFKYVIDNFKQSGVKRLIGVVIPNEANFRMEKLFIKYGFKLYREQNGEKYFEKK